jgi:predicted O-linked N-acetylglucosamine transferase (SPINDLY family)
VPRDRVEFVGRLPREDYLRLYHQIDVALDTFPYNGHTTTCDALWMGVPTVTLAGRTHVSRAGLNVLTQVGLPELVCADADAYVRAAVALTSDLDELAAMRPTLRERMRRSPLTDAPGLTRRVESVYHDICEGVA